MAKAEISTSVEHQSVRSPDHKRILSYYNAIAGVGLAAVLVVDKRSTIRYASTSVRLMLGLDADSMVGSDLRSHLHPDDAITMARRLERASAGENEDIALPARFLSANGRWRIMDTVARTTLEDSNADIVLGLSDVTVRVEAQQRLKDVCAQRDRAQRVARVSNWEMNTTTRMVSGSDQFFRILRIEPQDCIPFQKLTSLVRSKDADRLEEAIRTLQTTFEPMDITFRVPGLNGDPTRVIQMLGEIEFTGHDMVAFGTAQDITQSQNLQDALRKRKLQLRNLMTRLHTAQEQERKRLAREVHDVLGQAMTALRMDAVWLRDNGPNDDVFAKRSGEFVSLIDETIGTVRRISHELRPGVLDHFGLGAALEWQSEQFCDRAGIACNFVDLTEGELEDLDPDVATALFRIFQEALTNVARHAGASRVDVEFRLMPGNAVVLRIVDNGRGITEEEMATTTSLGLLNMRERVMPWGGHVDIRGGIDKGTTVEVTVPLSEPNKLN